MTLRRIFPVPAFLLAVLSAVHAEQVALTVVPAPSAVTQEVNFAFSHTNAAVWLEADILYADVFLRADAPAGAFRALAWLKDRDDNWFQHILEPPLVPGVTNVLAIPFAANAAGWRVPGRPPAWHYRTRLNPQSIGLRVFGSAAATGRCDVVSASLALRKPSGAPRFTGLRSLTREPRAFACYEAAFALPDRYTNPFDPACIDAGARITGPTGRIDHVTAFYYQPCYRLRDELAAPVEPNGAPEWRLRYCPLLPGGYAVTLYAKDRFGETVWTNALRFTAAEARPEDAHGFVRVSKKDARYFAFDDGTPYYPIGHNVRSPTDSRMDDKYPWRFRFNEGTVVYERYFARMRENGENWAEVWMSDWSLGIEWAEGIGGYHGAGDYHLRNAWELDQVLGLAAANGIRVNLVLNYHGRVSSWCDPQWRLHPYNKATGGWLTNAIEFFDDPRAIEMQKRFMRYTQARWGWDPTIFSYELCSEINLAGDKHTQRTNFETNVVEWCCSMTDYLHGIDPNRHLVTTHVSIDHRTLNPVICTYSNMDFNAVDAYHFDPPERIATLLAETADKGNGFQRPILVTEFGGSPMAASLQHILSEQHIGLWAGVCLPLAGTPMFWWWQVIDENNLYPRYAALKQFTDGIDFQNPAAKRVAPLLTGEDAKGFLAVGTAAPDAARGYVYPPNARAAQPPVQAKKVEVTLSAMTPGIHRVEFFETARGGILRKLDLRVGADGKLTFSLPRFHPDCAFRSRLITK